MEKSYTVNTNIDDLKKISMDYRSANGERTNIADPAQSSTKEFKMKEMVDEIKMHVNTIQTTANAIESNLFGCTEVSNINRFDEPTTCMFDDLIAIEAALYACLQKLDYINERIV